MKDNKEAEMRHRNVVRAFVDDWCIKSGVAVDRPADEQIVFMPDADPASSDWEVSLGRLTIWFEVRGAGPVYHIGIDDRFMGIELSSDGRVSRTTNIDDFDLYTHLRSKPLILDNVPAR